MRGPGIPRGVSVGDLAINADLAPTIVDVANANPGLVMDGRSLIPVARNPGIESGRELLIEQPSFEATGYFHADVVHRQTGWLSDARSHVSHDCSGTRRERVQPGLGGPDEPVRAI